MNVRITISTLLVTFLIFACVCQVHGQKRNKIPYTSTCAAQIEAVLRDTIFNRVFTGAHVVSLKSGKVIFHQNAGKLFRPASTLKLFTTAAAIKLLGTNFQLRTECTVDSASGGVVDGSLYVKGYGDPLLTTAHLDSLARMVVAAGIREIRGDIVGDVAYFDDIFWGRGWMWDDDPGPLWPYITPLAVNGNTISISIAPGLSEGLPVNVLLDPPTRYVTVVNNGITTFDTIGRTLKISRLWKERLNTITVDGALHPYASSLTVRFNVWKPELYALEVFSERLIANGIAVQGGVRTGKAEGGYHVGSLQHSLDSVILAVNKDSYNLGAEVLLKILAAEARKLPGSADTGIVIVKQFLSSLGIDTAAVVMVDGSGVSRYNLVSPGVLTRLLTSAYRDPDLFPPFWNSLPIGGVDGTLKTRFVNSVARGNVRAKTGGHSDAAALAGYVITTRKDTLAFSVMFNHYSSTSELYRKALDRIVEILTTCR